VRALLNGEPVREPRLVRFDVDPAALAGAVLYMHRVGSRPPATRSAANDFYLPSRKREK
jgi:hypothetical protein